MFIKKIQTLNNIESLGATDFAKECARKKGTLHYFHIHDIALTAALILKQEAISAGGDFILPKECILCEKKQYSGILIATESQLDKIIKKCALQPFGLSKAAKILQSHAVQNTRKTQIMGIINITPDSFYEHSRVQKIDEMLQRIERMIEYGAEIIDIGGASSRPGSQEVDSSEELSRLKDSIQAIQSAGLTQKTLFSIDSYNYETLKFCLLHGFHIINDVYGLSDESIIDLGLEFGAHIVLMHNSFITPHSTNIIQSLDEFFHRKLEALDKKGVARNRIVLDIGFGFGKNSDENVELIRNLAHFRHFGCEILVGASRKRTIGEITSKDTNDRLYGTLALHQIAILNGANIIRCHDVEAHIDMLKTLRYICDE